MLFLSANYANKFYPVLLVLLESQVHRIKWSAEKQLEHLDKRQTTTMAMNHENIKTSGTIPARSQSCNPHSQNSP